MRNRRELQANNPGLGYIVMTLMMLMCTAMITVLFGAFVGGAAGGMGFADDGKINKKAQAGGAAIGAVTTFCFILCLFFCLYKYAPNPVSDEIQPLLSAKKEGPQSHRDLCNTIGFLAHKLKNLLQNRTEKNIVELKNNNTP